jgi:ATP-dependent Clp protease adaptor protein ClpS
MEQDDQNTQGGVLAEREIKAARPSLYKVLLHNDDYTPMDFVVDVLTRFFQKSHAQATEIMLAVHHKGVGLCGIYPYEIAETKVAQVTEAAREQEYPLQCTLERA